MSFILDALKKLEQKRQRGAVPDLMTVHVSAPLDVKKRLFWPYFILGALIPNAALFLIWLSPWETSVPSPAIKKSVDAENASTDKRSIPHDTVTSQKPAEKHASEAQLKKQVPPEVDRQRPLPEKSVSQAPAVPAEKPVRPTRDIQQPKTSTDKSLDVKYTQESSSSDKPRVSDTDKTGNGVPELNQLSQSAQSEIPELRIFGHIYSNSPDTRLININGDIYKEGDTVANNLKVEEIIESGVILNYGGTRFRLRAF